MKNKVFLVLRTVLLFCACALAASCASVKVSKTTVDELGESEFWGARDVQKVCAYMIDDALAFPAITRFAESYAAGHAGEAPAVILGRFRNVSSEPIDTSILSTVLRTAILRSGKLAFVEGGAARDEIRSERADQHDGYASDATATTLGNETAAQLMLQGTVNSIVSNLDNVTTRTYYVTATITNIETSRIIWESDATNAEYQVVKTVKRSKARL
jgi:hypothetical protein